MILAFLLMQMATPLARSPGLRFKLFLAGYLLRRVLANGIKTIPYVYPLGLSGIQLVAGLALSQKYKTIAI